MNLLILAGLGIASFLGAMYFSKNAEEKASTTAIGISFITLIIMAYLVVTLQIGVVEGEGGRTIRFLPIALLLIGVPVVVYYLSYMSIGQKTYERNPWEGKTISEMFEQSKDVKRAGLLIVIAALVGLMLIWRYGR